MSRNLKEEVVKLAYLYKSIDSLMLIKDSNLSDNVKRNYMRFFFITIDNVLKNVSYVKNQIKLNELLNKFEIRDLTDQIITLSKSFDGSYDVIRDKISAHQQKLDLDLILKWWGDIDDTTISVLFNDLDNIRLSLSKAFSEFNDRILNVKLEFPHNEFTTGTDIPRFGYTRTSFMEPNSISNLAIGDMQEKEALVTSAKRFIGEDLYLTVVFDNSETNEAGAVLFNIGWSLAIVDFISFLDGIYNDYLDANGIIIEKSLTTHWKELNVIGLDTLLAIPRNFALEAEIQDVRNKMAAHLDSKQSLQDTYNLWCTLDLEAVHKYIIEQVNAYFNACRKDKRTEHIPRDGVPISRLGSKLLITQRPNQHPFDK